MARTKWAELFGDLPEDQIEENGVVVVYGGQGACAAITDTLIEMGFEVEPPYSEGMNGWVFDSKKGPLKVWMQVTDLGGSYYLAVRERRLFSTPKRRTWFDEHFLVPLNESLKRNARFTQVVWTNPDKHIEGGDRASPTDPAVPWR